MSKITTGNLRAKLIESIDRVMSGAMSAQDASAIAKLAGQLNASLLAEVEVGKRDVIAKADQARFGELALASDGDMERAQPKIINGTPAITAIKEDRASVAPKRNEIGRAEIEAGNRELQAALGLTNTFPLDLGGQHFTRQEANFLEVFLKRSQVSVEAAMIATHDPADGDDERDAKIVDVILCKVRAKLKPLGITIDKEWGGGMRMDATNKARLRLFVEKSSRGADTQRIAAE